MCVSHQALSLPIGFGTTPGNLEYDELKSKNFYIYHDHRTPMEAKLTLNALEAVKPVLEKWFKIKRDSPLPVIVSATTANASFANFITDAVELQTMGVGTRDLVWHEYVHSTMYRHFDNWLGPAGSILHLMWLPSWFVEGLAEALSMSTGSDQMAAIERYQALTGDWPSYEKLHSLYSKADFSFRGYATAGGLVNYLLANANTERLPDFLEDYFFKSMPWWWPYSILPLDSMPLDRALKNYVGMGGEELYQRYKKDAKRYWQANTTDKLWVAEKSPGSHADFTLTHTLQARGKNVYKLESITGDLFESKVNFKKNWAVSLENVTDVDDDAVLSARIMNEHLQVAAFDTYDLKARTGFALQARRNSNEDWTTIIERSGYINDLYESEKNLVWLEQAEEHTQFCALSKKNLKSLRTVKSDSVKCNIQFTQPRILSFLGARVKEHGKGNFLAQEIWLKVTEQTLVGNRFQMLKVDPDRLRKQEMILQEGGEPISLAFLADEKWLLVGERQKRALRIIDDTGKCKGVHGLADLALSVHGTDDGNLILPVFAGEDIAILRLDAKDRKTSACYDSAGHISPLIYALSNPQQNSLKNAIANTSLHYQPTKDEIGKIEKGRSSAVSIDEATKAKTLIDKKSKPASTRVRPIFAVPWIGADSGGTQLGILSIPLMDHMQNHSVRTFLAYGPESRFPHTQVTYVNTSFWPALELDAFRYQTWDGSFLDDQDIERNAYLDERGGRFTAHFFMHSLNTSLSLGIKASELKPYYNPEYARTGHVNEPFASLSYFKAVGAYGFDFELQSAVAPASINSDFEYNTAGASVGLTRSFDTLDAVLGLGVEGSLTRGKKPRLLQEVYRPLKIFVPGSGGGLNNLNFPIAGGGELFDATYGNNQVRGRGNLTFPLLSDVDTLVRLFYLDRLDFTAFFNYGGAWYGEFSNPPPDTFIAAHGYNLDLQFDIKGINFNVGGGVGQVVENPFEVYMTFGFDAIIE